MRRALAAALVACLGGAPALAAPALRIDWGDLIPMGPLDALLGGKKEIPRGFILHGELTRPPPGGTKVVHRYDGRTVTLTGYVIPLDTTAKGATAFMLVPFVGACIHVPPPPPNQLVYVTTRTPVRMDALFAPFTVTGTLGTAPTATDLADVGYTLKADKVVAGE